MKNNTFKNAILILSMSLISYKAFSITQTNVTIGQVGSEGHAKQVYVELSPNTNSCLNGWVYFTDSAESQGTLSVALAAKLAGKKVQIDYMQDENTGKCIGESIYIQ